MGPGRTSELKPQSERESAPVFGRRAFKSPPPPLLFRISGALGRPGFLRKRTFPLFVILAFGDISRSPWPSQIPPEDNERQGGGGEHVMSLGGSRHRNIEENVNYQ